MKLWSRWSLTFREQVECRANCSSASPGIHRSLSKEVNSAIEILQTFPINPQDDILKQHQNQRLGKQFHRRSRDHPRNT